MLELKVLVRELGSVNGLAASAIALGKVSTLDHELLDDTVKGRALVAKALFASRKSPAICENELRVDQVEVLPKVFGSLGRSLSIEANHDTSHLFIAMSDVEVDLHGRISKRNGALAVAVLPCG